MALKLFVFDMEKTLFRDLPPTGTVTPQAHARGAWAQLVHSLGEQAILRDAELARAWDNGDYASYIDWCDASLRSMAECGLDQALFTRVLDRFKYNEGVQEVISALLERGIRTAIISGGFAEQARRAQADLHIAHAYTAVDLIWSRDGRLAFWNILPCDYRGKINFLRLMMDEYRVTTGECAFVGDGHNDIPVAKEVGLSFAYNAPEAFRSVATFSITRFSQIIDHLNHI